MDFAPTPKMDEVSAEAINCQAPDTGYFYVWARSLRIADGPDAVHRRSIAREELRRQRPFVG